MSTQELIERIFLNIDDKEIMKYCLEKITHNSDCAHFDKYILDVFIQHGFGGMKPNKRDKYLLAKFQIFAFLVDYGGIESALALVLGYAGHMLLLCPDIADELCIKIAAKKPHEKIEWGAVVTPNFMSLSINDIYDSVPLIFKKNIQKYIETKKLTIWSVINGFPAKIGRSFCGRRWWSSPTNSVQNLRYMISLIEDKKPLVSELLVPLLKLYHMDHVSKYNIVYTIIKDENINNIDIFALCVKYIDVDSINYLLDKKYTFNSTMVDEMFAELKYELIQNREETYIKRVDEMLKLIMNHMTFTDNQLVTIAALDLLPLSDITSTSIPKNIKSLFKQNTASKSLEELLCNPDATLSEAKKIVKKSDKITSENIVRAVYFRKRPSIIEYLLDCDTDVTLECISVIKNNKIKASVLKKAVLKYNEKCKKEKEKVVNTQNIAEPEKKEELPVKKLIKKRNKNDVEKCDMKNDNT